jgi:hypothetical protein
VCVCVCVCVCDNVYYSRSEGQKKEGMEKQWGRQPEAMDMAADTRSIQLTSAGGLHFLQVLQNETNRLQDLLS